MVLLLILKSSKSATPFNYIEITLSWSYIDIIDDTWASYMILSSFISIKQSLPNLKFIIYCLSP